MPKAKDDRAVKAFELFKQGQKLTEIAKQLGVKEGTVRSWKKRYGWDATLRKSNATLQTKKGSEESGKEQLSEQLICEIAENSDLTDKQRLFCIYYIKSFNATKAYQKAYQCSYNTAMVEGCRSLRNPKIKSEITKLKQGLLNRELLSEDDIVQKYIDIAFADISDYVEFGAEEIPVLVNGSPVIVEDRETGENRPLTRVANYVRFRDGCTVDGTLISEIKQGKDGASVKLADRMKALEFLAEHVTTGEDRTDDGFLDALNRCAREDWADERE